MARLSHVPAVTSVAGMPTRRTRMRMPNSLSSPRPADEVLSPAAIPEMFMSVQVVIFSVFRLISSSADLGEKLPAGSLTLLSCGT